MTQTLTPCLLCIVPYNFCARRDHQRVSAVASADTLVDIYELALENDAQLKAQVAQYNADIELEKLALAPLLHRPRGLLIYRLGERLHAAQCEGHSEGTLDQIDVTLRRTPKPTGTTSVFRRHSLTCQPGLAGKRGKKPPGELRLIFLRRNRISSSGWCSPTLACFVRRTISGHRKPKSAPLNASSNRPGNDSKSA